MLGGSSEAKASLARGIAGKRSGVDPGLVGGRLLASALVATTAVLVVPVSAAAGSTDQRRLTSLRAPVAVHQQTALGFGERSHWLQPWRGYVDTVPARRVSRALGINFNVHWTRAATVARLLARAGFRRARFEVGWCSMSYDDPATLADPAPLEHVLQAFRDNRLRPLILLNAHHGCPGPLRRLELRVTAPADAGDRSVELDAASAARVVPGRTGLDSRTSYKAAASLFTSVTGTTATLAKPLETDLEPGTYPASTLRFEPFRRPGEPGFKATMQGWLQYVRGVTRKVKAVLGDDAFDVEVWNELGFGSDFLDINRYYSPAIANGGQKATEDAILRRTISLLRAPENGVSDVGIGNGFASQRPWEAGSTSPAGLTAIDKHPYAGRRSFPRDAKFDGIRPLDALGRPDGWQDAAGRWHDSFIPRYDAFFPEYFLTGIQTEHLVRDLSPITTDVYGTPHGRYTSPPNSPPPKLWVTETGLDPSGVPAPVLPRFKAKQALRIITAWVNKGAHAVHLFAAEDAGAPWALVDREERKGGHTLRALGRLTSTLASGRGRITRPRAVTLRSVADSHGHRQFGGDGTSAHPPLYDRDVVAFFPFQVSNRRVVLALYVMTRDLLRPYRRALPDDHPRRYDLPPARFRLALGGVSGLGRVVRATDPLTGRRSRVRVIGRRGDRLVLDVWLTDSPRLVVLARR